MLHYEEIIARHYNGRQPLTTILLTHSRQVAEMTVAIADRHPELSLNREFLYEAAMLHDIGIIKPHAPTIDCFGTEHYIRHGLLGGEMLRAEGLPHHARVCERHTGAGLTAAEIIAHQLPLPAQDWLPETLEEQVICYADKFFSKTRLHTAATPDHVQRSLAKFGPDTLQRFMQWHSRFAL